MSKNEKWKYVDGKLKEKITTKTDSDGNKEIIRQKAYSDWTGRHATDITSRTKIVK